MQACAIDGETKWLCGAAGGGSSFAAAERPLSDAAASVQYCLFLPLPLPFPPALLGAPVCLESGGAGAVQSCGCLEPWRLSRHRLQT